MWTTALAPPASAAAPVFPDKRVVAGFLSAVGVTNQRETTLVWDKETGEPLYNAIGGCIQ